MSLVVPEAHQQFQVRTSPLVLGTCVLMPHKHILRLLNTNVDGKRKIMYALTEIKGVGRRYANLVCKKADVDLNKRWVFLVKHGGVTQSPAALASSTRMNLSVS